MFLRADRASWTASNFGNLPLPGRCMRNIRICAGRVLLLATSESKTRKPCGLALFRKVAYDFVTPPVAVMLPVAVDLVRTSFDQAPVVADQVDSSLAEYAVWGHSPWAGDRKHPSACNLSARHIARYCASASNFAAQT